MRSELMPWRWRTVQKLSIHRIVARGGFLGDDHRMVVGHGNSVLTLDSTV